MLSANELLTLLHQEVVPALGCTEPVCVALAAAAAHRAIGGQIVSIHVDVNANVFKNGMSVGIPGCANVGLNYAAALGACLSNPEKGLELLSGITAEINALTAEMIEMGRVKIAIDEDELSLYVHAQVITTSGLGTATIRDSHANIVFVKANDEVLVQREASTAGADVLHGRLKEMTLAQLRAGVESIPEGDLRPMLDGMRMNGALADYGLEHPVGVGIGAALQKLSDSDVFGHSLLSRIMTRTAACAESRMSGCPYAVMSSAGSGNHGITAILPVVELAGALGKSEAELARALALSHLVTVYIKQYTGRLSAICGCGMTAATGAAVAMTWLMGGDDSQLAMAVTNMTANLTGIICDGGKVGCALKLASAASAALMSAYLAIDGVAAATTDGVVGETAEASIANMGLISSPGMTETDRVILDIMLKKTQQPV